MEQHATLETSIEDLIDNISQFTEIVSKSEKFSELMNVFFDVTSNSMFVMDKKGKIEFWKGDLLINKLGHSSPDTFIPYLTGTKIWKTLQRSFQGYKTRCVDNIKGMWIRAVCVPWLNKTICLLSDMSFEYSSATNMSYLESFSQNANTGMFIIKDDMVTYATSNAQWLFGKRPPLWFEEVFSHFPKHINAYKKVLDTQEKQTFTDKKHRYTYQKLSMFEIVCFISSAE